MCHVFSREKPCCHVCLSVCQFVGLLVCRSGGLLVWRSVGLSVGSTRVSKGCYTCYCIYFIVHHIYKHPLTNKQLRKPPRHIQVLSYTLISLLWNMLTKTKLWSMISIDKLHLWCVAKLFGLLGRTYFPLKCIIRWET